jgi:predicted Zn-dependent protease
MSTQVVRYEEDVTVTRAEYVSGPGILLPGPASRNGPASRIGPASRNGPASLSGVAPPSCARSRSSGRCAVLHRAGSGTELRFGPLSVRRLTDLEDGFPPPLPIEVWWPGFLASVHLAETRADQAGARLSFVTARHVDQRVAVWRDGNRIQDRRSYSFVRLGLRSGSVSLADSAVFPGAPGEAAEAVAAMAAGLAGDSQLLAGPGTRGDEETLGASRAKPKPDLPGGGTLVVLSGSAAAFFVHEVCSHALEGDALVSRTSVLASLRGRRVAPDFLDIADVGGFPGCPAGLGVDDEGTVPGKTPLVENGMLTGAVYDLSWARAAGVASTGNGRRQNHRAWALPRPIITLVRPGEGDVGDLVQAMDEGYHVTRVTNGRANVVTGAFELAAPLATLIRGGRPAGWAGPCVLTGDIRTALAGLLAVGHAPEVWAQLCGKGGQLLPVGTVSPPLLCSGLTMGVTGFRARAD